VRAAGSRLRRTRAAHFQPRTRACSFGLRRGCRSHRNGRVPEAATRPAADESSVASPAADARMRLSTFAARARVERGQEYLRPAAACAVLAALGAIASTNPGTDSGQRAQCQKQRPSLQRCGKENPCHHNSGAHVRVRTHLACVRARRNACVPEARTACRPATCAGRHRTQTMFTDRVSRDLETSFLRCSHVIT
jgi:hypothetical protein